ncbi:MAG: hypothetical protein R3232_05725, partial [Clostridia bacterium]|nr:hypothetical protein [Clostridia bacterium]
HRSDWLEAAEKAGRYYRRFNERGCWNGGPGDILMAPDSESTYAAMEAFYHLYTATGKELWKSEFLKASKLMSTWICMVDFDFPKGTTYQRLVIYTKGLVGANSQNKTLAPGICTASGYLFYKAAELADNDFFKNIPRMLLDGASYIAEAFDGSIPEDVNASDSLADRGELYTGHGIWTENAYLLMTMENYYE